MLHTKYVLIYNILRQRHPSRAANKSLIFSYDTNMVLLETNHLSINGYRWPISTIRHVILLFIYIKVLRHFYILLNLHLTHIFIVL